MSMVHESRKLPDAIIDSTGIEVLNCKNRWRFARFAEKFEPSPRRSRHFAFISVNDWLKTQIYGAKPVLRPAV